MDVLNISRPNAQSRSYRQPQRRQSVLGILRGRIALWRSRRALAALTPGQLHDIGITRAEARREARRGIWDAPAHWRL